MTDVKRFFLLFFLRFPASENSHASFLSTVLFSELYIVRAENQSNRSNMATQADSFPESSEHEEERSPPISPLGMLFCLVLGLLFFAEHTQLRNMFRFVWDLIEREFAASYMINKNNIELEREALLKLFDEMRDLLQRNCNHQEKVKLQGKIETQLAKVNMLEKLKESEETDNVIFEFNSCSHNIDGSTFNPNVTASRSSQSSNIDSLGMIFLHISFIYFVFLTF